MSFFKSDVRVEKLATWLDWSGEVATDVFVALPMIQRGSVWKPNQIIDLWDSLLQGMPIGSLMISELQPGTPVRRQGQKKSEVIPVGGGLGLIDGQQRTLAMLAAWPLAIKIDRRIWVDFADEPTAGHLLTLRVTSTNQPFGFRRDDPSKKLSLDDRRKALEKHNSGFNERGEVAKVLPASIENAWPYSHSPSLPVDLRWLIETWRKSDPESWGGAVLKRIEAIMTAIEASSTEPKVKAARCNWPKDAVLRRIENLKQSLTQLFEMELPLIRVDNRFFDTKNTENKDPPLALLFKRIGTGGTKLSDADYVYSIIKHLYAKTYDLVESLYDPTSGTHNIASLLNSTDLVMSTVRLAAADWSPNDGKPIPDRESPSKPDFHKLLGRGDFLQERFLPLIEPASNAKTSLIVEYFDQIQNCLEYCPEKNGIGLPRHLFPHVGRPLVQVLLRIAQKGYLEGDIAGERQKDMVRLVLFWMVAVNDQRKASEVAYRVIKNNIDSSIIEKAQLGKSICKKLIEEKIAVELIPPSLIEQRVDLAKSSKTPTTLSSNARFIPIGDVENGYKNVYDFYRRWWRPWTYHHPMLLWLQREHVTAIKGDPMAGREEDTPYDYDHILPFSHWGDWRGTGNPPSFSGGEIGVIGNGIGNVRVWDSSSNRGDGDVAPAYKLRLVANPDEEQSVQRPLLTPEELLRLSAIPNFEEHRNFWQICSGLGADKREWSLNRVSAFQAASESRAFHLYGRYFSEPNFAEWFEAEVAAQEDMPEISTVEISN